MEIAVVGSMNMDMIIHADRIPLKGETIPGSSIEYQPGGKGANQAVAMAKLGARVIMFGCVGNDTAGKKLIKNMAQYGVNTEHINILEEIPTGQAFITVGEKDNTIIIIAGANNYVSKEYAKNNHREILKADIIVLQNEIPEETIDYVIRLCHKHNKTIVWNPAPARKLNPELLEMATYLTPNEHEAQVIWGEEAADMANLLPRYPGKLIITRGEKGGSINTNEKGIITLPAIKVEVKDTTGAGDTLNGAFCVGLSKKMQELQALEFANIAAGLSVQKCGAQIGMPDITEVEKILLTSSLSKQETQAIASN